MVANHCRRAYDGRMEQTTPTEKIELAPGPYETRDGSLGVVLTGRSVKCDIDDCQSNAKRRGWRGKHYTRWKKHGDPMYEFHRNNPKERRGAFRACWEWPEYRNARGYSKVRHEGKSQLVHRVVFIEVNGWVPESVCHRCDNPDCFRPDHLWDSSREHDRHGCQGS